MCVGWCVCVCILVLTSKKFICPGGVPVRGCTCPGGVPAQVLPLWTEFLTHTTENITLPQTSFAGAKNIATQ